MPRWRAKPQAEDTRLVKASVLTQRESHDVKKGKALFNVYAEFSKKQMRQVMDGEYQICHPLGVEMTWKLGSKACFFTCDDEDTLEELMNGLDNCYINWQLDVS